MGAEAKGEGGEAQGSEAHNDETRHDGEAHDGEPLALLLGGVATDGIDDEAAPILGPADQTTKGLRQPRPAVLANRSLCAGCSVGLVDEGNGSSRLDVLLRLRAPGAVSGGGTIGGGLNVTLGLLRNGAGTGVNVSLVGGGGAIPGEARIQTPSRTPQWRMIQQK